MFHLTEEFLDGLGVDNQSEEVKRQLLTGAEQTIQQRVLMILSDQITDEMADELDGINQSTENAKKWLKNNLPNYETSAEFARIKESFTKEDDAVLAFAQAKWFEANLPTYLVEIQRVAEQVKQEMKSLGEMATRETAESA